MSAPGCPENVALVALGPGGLDLAATLKSKLPGAEVHGLKGRAEEGADVVFDEVAAHVRDLFGRPLVSRNIFSMILVRRPEEVEA